MSNTLNISLIVIDFILRGEKIAGKTDIITDS